ncbi:MAG: four helix bundle protein [Candidatus Latescibacteria bacterium]|jgi:four helix bundle protein|nr:four helix bundle protein [Candidatus Latescibacterota bacterium]
MVESYRDLEVWQRAMDLVVDCYGIAKDFPPSEVYGLKAQLQRTAVSVPANIAEGHGRSRTGDYLRLLSIAHGSLMELETHIQISQRLGYVERDVEGEVLGRCGEVGRMLNGLINALEKRRGG